MRTTSMATLIGLVLAASHQSAMAQTAILPNCNTAQSLGVLNYNAPASTMNPLVFQSAFPAFNGSFSAQSVAPVGAFSSGVVYTIPSVRTFSGPVVRAAPATVFSQPLVSNVPTQPLSTTRVRLTLQAISPANSAASDQTPTAAACACSPETIQRLSDRLDSLKARLVKLEQAGSRTPPGGNGDAVDDLLREVN